MKSPKQSSIADLTPIMTLYEVAGFLKVHASTVRTLLRNQGLPYFKIGADFRFHRDVVAQWIVDQEKQAQTECADRSQSQPKTTRRRSGRPSKL